MALPWRAPAVDSEQFRCISDDPFGVGGDRGRVVAQKLVVSPPIRFVTLSVLAGGRGDGTISIRRVCRDAKNDDPYSGRGVSWRQN